MKIILWFFAIIGFLVTIIVVYWILETLYYDHKYKKPKSKYETDFDKGFRKGQEMANM